MIIFLPLQKNQTLKRDYFISTARTSVTFKWWSKTSSIPKLISSPNKKSPKHMKYIASLSKSNQCLLDLNLLASFNAAARAKREVVVVKCG